MPRRANAVSMLTHEGYKIYCESIPLFMSGCESLGTVCFEDYFKVDIASSGHILDALARS